MLYYYTFHFKCIGLVVYTFKVYLNHLFQLHFEHRFSKMRFGLSSSWRVIPMVTTHEDFVIPFFKLVPLLCLVLWAMLYMKCSKHRGDYKCLRSRQISTTAQMELHTSIHTLPIGIPAFDWLKSVLGDVTYQVSQSETAMSIWCFSVVTVPCPCLLNCFKTCFQSLSGCSCGFGGVTWVGESLSESPSEALECSEASSLSSLFTRASAPGETTTEQHHHRQNFKL